MTRRDFISLISGAAAAWPLAAWAQTAPPLLRVGVVSAANPRTASFWRAFVGRMRDLGYIEGQNFILDFTNLQGELDRYPEETTALVRRKVDIIIASGVELALKSAVAAADSLPIVMVAADYDPLALGYVSSLARPSRNVTGLVFQQLELTEKRLQLVKEAFPELSAVTVLWDRISADQWQVAQRVAPKLGLRLAGIELGPPPHDFERLLSQAPSDHRRALLVLMTPAIFPDRARLAETAVRHGMGSMFGLRPYAQSGGLMSYGPNIDRLFERAAEYVDRIARGARPSDLPVEQPTRFELVINVNTAKALGLEIPATLLARADEVIE